MFRKFLIPSMMAAFLVTTAPVYAAMTMVKDVAVTVDMTSIKNQEAAKHFANLPDDLKNAIASELGDRATKDPDGLKLMVNVQALDLGTDYQTAVGTAKPALTGVVNLVSASSDTANQAFKVLVTVKDLGTYIPAGTDMTLVTTDSSIYYDAMVKAFAVAVAGNIK